MEQQVDFIRGKYRIFGMLHRPECELRGGVLFLHGFGGTRVEPGRLYVRTARRLARAGFASLRFDFSGCGDSEGEMAENSILGELEDALCAHRFFREQCGLESSQVGILGYSLGGAVASLLSAEVHPPVMVLWAPVSNPLEVFSGHLGIAPEELLKMEVYEAGSHHVGRPFIEEMPQVLPLEALRGFTGDFLTIHGSEDTVVLPEHSRRCLEAAKPTARSARLETIEGAGHGFFAPAESERLIQLSTDWFGQHLGRTA
jgi:pimeloyl-ACP methyl ester carboxylesterase